MVRCGDVRLDEVLVSYSHWWQTIVMICYYHFPSYMAKYVDFSGIKAPIELVEPVKKTGEMFSH